MVGFDFDPRGLPGVDARDGIALVGQRVADYLFGCLAGSRVPETFATREPGPAHRRGLTQDTRKMWGDGKWAKGLRRSVVTGTPVRASCEIHSLEKAQYRFALQRFAKAGEPAFITLRGRAMVVARKAVREYLGRVFVLRGSKVSLRTYYPSKRAKAWQPETP